MEGHIWIDDVIASDYHLEVKRQIAALKGATSLVVHIQSPGGSVFGGYNTYHVLKAAGKPIKTIVEGEAQSIATFIALAADPGQLEIRNPSVWMIHNPWNEIQGDASQLEAGASELRNIQAELANAYAARTGLPVQQILDMMAKTTSLTAQQAVQMKFADRIVEPVRAVALGKSNHSTMQHTEKDLNLISRLIAKTAYALGIGPKAVDLTLADGSMLQIDGEAPYEGKPATVNGAPAPDGVYTLQDGGTVTVAGGVVTATTAAASATPTPAAPAPAQTVPATTAPAPGAAAEAEAKVKDLEQALAAAKAEVETHKAAAEAAAAAKTEAENKAKEAENKVQATAQAFGELRAEFDKLTGGKTTPPAVATSTRTPGVGAQAAIDKDMMDELLSEPCMRGIVDIMAMKRD